VKLLKHIKIMKAAPTCFDLQRNHHQGATTSTWLKIQAWFNIDTDVVQTLSVLWRHNMSNLVPSFVSFTNFIFSTTSLSESLFSQVTCTSF